MTLQGAPNHPARSIERAALGRLQPLGKGGTGAVYLTSIATAAGTRLVFKEYRGDVRGRIDWPVLDAIASVPGRLSPAVARELLDGAAWPCARVTDGGRPVGFLMPQLPASFGVELRLPSGRRTHVPSHAHLLLQPAGFQRRRGIAVDNRRRLEFLVGAARIVSLLHDNRMAVGDLSPKNLLFGPLGGGPAYFVDCDSVVLEGRSLLPAVETPGWEVATVSSEPPGTAASDCYKFGLLVLRVLAGSQTTRDPASLPRGTDPLIRALVASSLSRDPAARPSITDWLIALAVQPGPAGRRGASSPTAKARQGAPSPTAKARQGAQRPTAMAPTPTSAPGVQAFVAMPASPTHVSTTLQLSGAGSGAVRQTPLPIPAVGAAVPAANPRTSAMPTAVPARQTSGRHFWPLAASIMVGSAIGIVLANAATGPLLAITGAATPAMKSALGTPANAFAATPPGADQTPTRIVIDVGGSWRPPGGDRWWVCSGDVAIDGPNGLELLFDGDASTGVVVGLAGAKTAIWSPYGATCLGTAASHYQELLRQQLVEMRATGCVAGCSSIRVVQVNETGTRYDDHVE